MFLRWLFLFVGFVLCLLGLQIYRNTALMDKGYLLQKLKMQKDTLIEENGYLQERLSLHFSLSMLEDYARKELGLVNPEKTRFLERNFSPPKDSPSPPPSIDKLRVGLGSWILRNIERCRGWLNIFHDEKK